MKSDSFGARWIPHARVCEFLGLSWERFGKSVVDVGAIVE